MSRIGLGLLATVLFAGTAAAQGNPTTGRPQEPPRQAQQGARVAPPAAPQMQLQHMAQHTERLRNEIRETNQWMAQHGSREEYRALGRQLEASCDQLRLMVTQTDQIRDRDRDLLRDPARLQDFDRLQDRLRDMDRSLTAAHDALRRMVGR